MNRKRFIQTAFIAWLPALQWDFDRALRAAERAWDKLTERGLGSTRPSGPRPLQDHYQALNERQRAWFERFWTAYGYKRGKQGAALRWGQLGELSDDDYQQIIDAARKDAERPLPAGQVRKMAQGWLAERRWEDHAPQRQAPANQHQERMRRLAADLAHARRMAEMGDDYWAGEAERLAREIDKQRSTGD